MESSVREVLGVLKSSYSLARELKPDRPSEVLKFELSLLPPSLVLNQPDIGPGPFFRNQERVIRSGNPLNRVPDNTVIRAYERFS